MEVPMEQTKQNRNHPAKGDSNPNPNAISEKTIKISEIPAFLENQGKLDYINRQKELDHFQLISHNTFHALVKDGNPFFSMRALNRKITDKVLIALIEELILLRDNDNPIAILSSTPNLIVWQSFFNSYDGTTTKSLTNTANASQSFRNMLACFPAKIKQVMKELNEQGLKNCWSIQKSNKQPGLNEEQIKFIDKFLQSQGVYNSSMDLSSRFKIFKTLKGKLPEAKETVTETETETETEKETETKQ